MLEGTPQMNISWNSGLVQPQRQFVLGLDPAHFETTQVAELFVLLTPLWRTRNENNKRREADKERTEGEEEKYRRGEKGAFFKW